MSQGMVLWTDGGFRSNNGGWGVHGYLFSLDVPKKGSGNPDHVLTKDGYIAKADVDKAEQHEVTPIHYIDGYGSVFPNATNNIAELLSTINGLRHAFQYEIEFVHVFTDSEYVRKGLEFWADKWKANNWVKHDGVPPANVDHWKELVLERDKLINRGTKVTISWVKAHSDILGNELADRLATVGVMAAIQNISVNEIVTTAAEGYWKYESNKHPFIANRRMYFNTMPEYIRSGEYFLGEHGTDDDMLGKKISDGAYAVVLLKEPDYVLELVRNYQSSIANDVDSIIMARLDKLYRSTTHRELITFKTLAMEQTNQYRLDLSCLDREPLTRELRPPKLAMRAVESISDLASKLQQYLDKDENIVITDITHILYEETRKTNKKEETAITTKLKQEYNVGYAALNVDVNYKTNDSISNVPVILTLGIDLLDRNSLKRLESYNPKVVVISWLEAPGIFRYATVIQTKDDVGIWAGCYSNLRIVT